MQLEVRKLTKVPPLGSKRLAKERDNKAAPHHQDIKQKGLSMRCFKRSLSEVERTLINREATRDYQGKSLTTKLEAKVVVAQRSPSPSMEIISNSPSHLIEQVRKLKGGKTIKTPQPETLVGNKKGGQRWQRRKDKIHRNNQTPMTA
ncbi:hypothetical protein LR48_Vigan08g043300 [Vigna angularis]|uniref:Uncharacterized protein n=1 Tax=Phaseolus angularis TaxID=3914 RepID=A0A0L9V3Q6_PHAAN|nr:hypothetical protein LR48_Vigan08g043300 [Vigna angularis]